MSKPGSLNALCDVSGIHVGHAEDARARTGVTVIRFDAAMRCAVDVRGGGPATRETPAVGPEATLGIAHGIALSGGSVFGLGAADVMAASLSAEGVGFSPVPGTPPVPIIPGASLYDLANGGTKDWGADPPYRRLALDALASTGVSTACGSVGAGYGAIAGAWRGGLGTASLDLGDGAMVAAMVAVNAIGSPVMPDQSAFWAWPFEIDGEFGGLRPGDGGAREPIPSDIKGGIAEPATCIGVIACSVALDRAALHRIAIMAQDGLARAIRPSHAPFDGDTLFVVCPEERSTATPADIMRLGSSAADCVARVVARGVWETDPDLPGPPAFRSSLFRSGG